MKLIKWLKSLKKDKLTDEEKLLEVITANAARARIRCGNSWLSRYEKKIYKKYFPVGATN